jgi:Leucine-rich repeat (LRR) protein
VDAAGGLVHNPCSHGGSSWQGVTCSGTPAECSSQVCQVAKLDLTYYNLLGTLPSDIGNLSSLIEFSLYTNALSGTIPSELGQLQALTFLDVDDNFLSGTVPVEMGQLTALRFLYLNNNQLTGPIPAEMGQLTVLRLLYLHFNLLTGSIPAEVGQLTDLLVLYIHDNQLTKSIPVEVGQLISLAYLTLYDNQLTGSIPVEVGKLTELMKLYLNTNQLTGPIPTEIGQLISLEYLILNDNQLTRSIPVEVGNLTALVQLYLDRNQLTGPIPIMVGQLTSLKQLILYGNQLTRSIPVEVGKLSALELLYLYRNQLTSSIPVVIGQLTALQRISIHSNQFTGTIPVEVGQLTALQRIAAYDNYLTGSIPIEVGQLAALESLSLDGNHLTGSVPIEVRQLTALQNIFLNDNLLTGPIPVEVGHMTALDRMIAYDNFLTGSIPVEVGKLTALEQLFLYSNLLTGTMPAEIGQLSVLNHLTLHNNLLTGPIPEEIGQLRYLKELLLYNNRLGGPIPGSFGYLEYIEELQLHDNLLTGTLPITLVGMMKLSNLFIQNNMLTGSLDGVFNHSAQLRLTTIDVSNNRFSGSAWEELFLLPQLQVLSLSGSMHGTLLYMSIISSNYTMYISICMLASGNCFTQQLSSALCRAERIEVLSMNGLGAAEECGGRTIVPLSGVALFNTIGGTIPSCVWALQNLTVLHLTGNGLTGELVSTLPAYTQLTDVSLSHNQLSGTLPLDIMKVTRRLDLSRNQFGGEYPDHTQSNVEYENINLEINRLSGQLPILGLELLLNSSLSVLRGNVFSCSTIPSNDDYTQDYVCGSRNLNYAMIGFVSAVAVVLLGVIAIQWGRMPTTSATPKPIRVVSTLRLKCMLLWTYFTCSQNLNMWHRSDVFAPAVRNILELSRSFIGVMRYAVQLATIVLVGSSVFYFVKALDSSRDYTTHSHTYSWFWTMAYMRGVVPAALLLAVWVGVITVSFYCVVARPWRRWHDIDDNDSCTEVGDYGSTHEKTEVARPAEVSTSGWYIARIGLVIVLNICSIAIVNAVYIYSTQQALSASVHLFLQLSMSIFRLLYSSMLCPILSQPVDNVAANIRFRFMLLMMNNLLLPCLVTAFTSDACFQVLFDASCQYYLIMLTVSSL